MNRNKKELLEEINDVLNNYKSRELRMGLRINTDSEYRKFAGYQYEGPILNVRYLEDELHITILDRSDITKENEEKIVRLLAYEKPIYDYNNEYEIQEIEYNLNRKDFQGEILEIKTGQNGKIAQHLVIRN